MALSQWALLGFTAWTMLLVLLGIGLPRISAVLAGRARANSFNLAVPHGSERYQRSLRAHLNCVENLPIFAALVLIGSLLSLHSQAFEVAAACVFPARVLQSSVHIASGRNRAVLARFFFYVVQWACFAFLVLLIALHAR